MISHPAGQVAFTAFPWEVAEERQEGESWIDMRERTEPDRNKLHAEKMANAQLIAAAPDLLSALHNMLEDGDKTDREQALRAIAKAEGKQ